MKKRNLLLFLSLFSVQSPFAQITQLKEINPGSNPSIASEKGAMAQLGNHLFFSADNSQTGVELWKTDGTTAGTVLVKDINPGETGSFPDHFYAVGNQMFFTADDGVAGRELWVTDGTEAGTILLADIRAGIFSAFEDWFLDIDFRDFYVFQNQLFFRAYTGLDGLELYKSDGTPAGTGLVKSIGFGANDGCQGHFAALNGELYFAGFSTSHGGQIWKTDGTGPGTVEVTTILEEVPEYLTTFGNMLIFVGDDGINGPELWKSDGTEAGTSLLKDTETAAGEGGLSHTIDTPESRFFVAGNKAYFSVDIGSETQAWVTDGTTGGTKKIHSVVGACVPSHFTQLGNAVLFVGCDFFEDILWRTNGTALTTLTIATYENGSLDETYSTFPALFTHDGKVWFSASGPSGTNVLYQTAGSAANTVVVNSFPINAFYEPKRFFSLGDKMIFWAKTFASGGNFEPFVYTPQLTVSGTVTSVKCHGGSDGSISVQPSGNPPFLTTWEPSTAAGLMPTGLAAGIYTVTVTDVFGITGTADFQVSAPNAIQLAFSASPQTGANPNGTATVNATGGTVPFQFLWNTTPPQTSTTATGLSAGTYSCTATDANGCVQTGEATVELIVNTNDPVEGNSVRLTPNPAAGWVNVHWENSDERIGKYRLFDASGKLIRIFENPASDQLNLDGVPNGLLVLQFFTKTNGWLTVRFLKVD